MKHNTLISSSDLLLALETFNKEDIFIIISGHDEVIFLMSDIN